MFRKIGNATCLMAFAAFPMRQARTFEGAIAKVIKQSFLRLPLPAFLVAWETGGTHMSAAFAH
jgi:hypothetical protein